jgi:hypothetical protein
VRYQEYEGRQRREKEVKENRARGEKREGGERGIQLIFLIAIGDDICVHRLNDDLTTKWLQKKVNNFFTLLYTF